MMKRPRFHIEDYTVGWVCALPVEVAAAQQMLDEEHHGPPQELNDTNIYILGRIGEHKVVIACPPAGQTGTNSAALVAVRMKSKFVAIRFGLMVGIGGGVPCHEADVRLGDVVVSQPYIDHGGVVQYDFGKTASDRLVRTGFLNKPPTILLEALAELRVNHIIRGNNLSIYLSALSHLPEFTRDNAGPDILFESTYNHVGGDTCERCSKDRLVERSSRTSEEVMIHYGTIASGNQVMSDGVTRDRSSSELGGVLCFEMEAAGIMNSFPCLIIRGICDYADSHRNKKWQAYAAATAAACAKEILSVIPAIETRDEDRDDASSAKSSYAESIFSLASISSYSTVPTAYSQEELLSAAEELAILLANDEVLKPLYPCALESKRIGADRFIRNFRRLLKVFSRGLESEAQRPEHKLVANFVRIRAAFVAQYLRYLVEPATGSLNLDLGVPVDEIKKERLEEFLRSLNGALKEDLGAEPGRDGESSDSEDELENEPEQADISSLTEVTAFILSSMAFEKLRRDFQDFVQPKPRKEARPKIERVSPDTRFYERAEAPITALETFSGNIWRAESVEPNVPPANQAKRLIMSHIHSVWSWLVQNMQSPPLGYQRITWTCVSYYGLPGVRYVPLTIALGLWGKHVC